MLQQYTKQVFEKLNFEHSF